MTARFKLTPELTDQIIFAMENQTKNFYLDPSSLLLISEDHLDTVEDRDALIELPDWNPSDGYQLMDSFTGLLKNPVYRERLRQILSSGRGVFRGFKNVLKERPDLEKLWFSHKDREMKKRVRLWYGELCEFWGVESLGEEPEETEDLFLDEFTMEESWEEDGLPDDFAGLCEQELYRDYPESVRRLLLSAPSVPDGHKAFLKAVSPEGMICGVLGFTLKDEYAVLNCLYVLPEYRGAGIASGLLDSASRSCYEKGSSYVIAGLPPEGEILLENFKRRGFRAAGAWLILDLQHWYYEQGGKV